MPVAKTASQALFRNLTEDGSRENECGALNRSRVYFYREQSLAGFSPCNKLQLTVRGHLSLEQWHSYLEMLSDARFFLLLCSFTSHLSSL